ncbi:CHAD domain-containing protein, partial [Burkholderia vietnamiensis]|nr:CHAD domain-containing protein [Burkholderia vietnamiensis]
MSRVLEIVLSLSLESWPVKAASRARGGSRDFGAELVRAWRICPQVRMRRGHERVTIEPCRIHEAEPDAGGRWCTWVESTAHGPRVVASRTRPFAPGVVERELFDAEHAGIAVAAQCADARPADAEAEADAENDAQPGAADDGATATAVDEAARAAASGAGPLRLVSERRRGRWAD